MSSVTVKGAEIDGRLRRSEVDSFDAAKTSDQFFTIVPQLAGGGLESLLEAHHVTVTAQTTSEGSLPTTLLLVAGAAVLLVLVFVWALARRAGSRLSSRAGGVLGMGASRARVYDQESPRTTFADVAGIDEVKEELQQVVGFLRQPGGQSEQEQTLNQILVEMDGFDSDAGVVVLAVPVDGDGPPSRDEPEDHRAALPARRLGPCLGDARPEVPPCSQAAPAVGAGRPPAARVRVRRARRHQHPRRVGGGHRASFGPRCQTLSTTQERRRSSRSLHKRQPTRGWSRTVTTAPGSVAVPYTFLLDRFVDGITGAFR